MSPEWLLWLRFAPCRASAGWAVTWLWNPSHSQWRLVRTDDRGEPCGSPIVSCLGAEIQFSSRMATFLSWSAAVSHLEFKLKPYCTGVSLAVWIALCCAHLPDRPLRPEFVLSSEILRRHRMPIWLHFPKWLFLLCVLLSLAEIPSFLGSEQASWAWSVPSLFSRCSASWGYGIRSACYVLAWFGDWLMVTMWPILGNLSYCEAFFGQYEELNLVIFWQVLDVWVFGLVRTRSCILAQSGKCFGELQLCDQVVIHDGLCQASVWHFPDCFPFIQIVLITLLDEALE